MSMMLDLYLIATRRNRYVLFSPTDVVAACEADAEDRVRHFIGWFTRRRNRIAAWVGRVLRVGHDYYEKLEDRIDPVERILKAMAYNNRWVVHFAPTRNAENIRRHFEDTLRQQRRKHIFWISIDILICVVVMGFTPVLAPIPGPNIFFYYPFLRLISHYRALRGTTSGLRFSAVEFKSLPDLSGLEENLQTRVDRNAIHAMAERLQIRGLEQFLERMV